MAEEVLDPSLQKIKTELTLFALLEGGFVKRFMKAFNTAGIKLMKRPIRDSRPGFEGWTLLHHAAMLGDTKVISFLVNKGHSVDVADSSISRVTPLMVAVTHDKGEATKELVNLGADLSLTDMSGENAIHYGARVSGTIIKDMLFAANADKEQILALVTTPNCKSKLPEQICSSEVVKETLVNFRVFGYIPTKVRNLPRKTRMNPLLVQA